MYVCRQPKKRSQSRIVKFVDVCVPNVRFFFIFRQPKQRSHIRYTYLVPNVTNVSFLFFGNRKLDAYAGGAA